MHYALRTTHYVICKSRRSTRTTSRLRSPICVRRHIATRWRHVKVTQRRTILDVAHCFKDLVDAHFPDADVIRLVMDQLNTHTLSVLYEVFDASEARRIARKLEIHHTPKHGSWLNMAEIELAVLNAQCLDRRIADLP